MILEIDNLHTEYTLGGSDRALDAVSGISFEIREGEVFGLVGESGCGKSTVAKSIMGTLPENGDIVQGDIRFKDKSLPSLSTEEFRQTRWEDIALISQSAMNALDPVYTVGDQIREAIEVHRDMSRRDMDERIEELFEIVGIDTERIDDYPHQFSGGMKQRAMIAMALVLDPDLIIADEPTTALDVISQDTILYHLEEIQERTNAAMLLITHDMSVVAETCNRIGVMYAGQMAESGDTEHVLTEPMHPYSMGLKNAFPSIADDMDELVSIPGSPPNLLDIDEQCRFAERCPFASDECWNEVPETKEYTSDGSAACLRIDELGVEEMRRHAAKRSTWIDDGNTETAPMDDKQHASDTSAEGQL